MTKTKQVDEFAKIQQAIVAVLVDNRGGLKTMTLPRYMDRVEIPVMTKLKFVPENENGITSKSPSRRIFQADRNKMSEVNGEMLIYYYEIYD